MKIFWRNFSIFSVLVLLCLTIATHEQSKARKADERNVSYGANRAQKLDVWLPPFRQNKPRAAVVLVHGGAWEGGDKSELNERARELSQEGFVVFNVNYRLVTNSKNRFPDQLDDAQRAVRWVRSQAARYNVDAQKIGVLGESAGAHLAALLGTTDTRDNSDGLLSRYSSRVQCVVDLFGPTDFTAALPQDSSRHSTTLRALMVRFFGGTSQQNKGEYVYASPLFHVDSSSAPFLIFQGARDVTVPLDQSQRLHAALQSQNIESQLVVYSDEAHGFKNPNNLRDVSIRTSQFLHRHLDK